MRMRRLSITKIGELACEGRLWRGCVPQDVVRIRNLMAPRASTSDASQRDGASPSPSFSAAAGHGLLHHTVPPHPQDGEEVRRLRQALGPREAHRHPPMGRNGLGCRPITPHPPDVLYSFQLRLCSTRLFHRSFLPKSHAAGSRGETRGRESHRSFQVNFYFYFLRSDCRRQHFTTAHARVHAHTHKSKRLVLPSAGAEKCPTPFSGVKSKLSNIAC